MQPKQNPVFSRYKFNNEIQGAQPIEQYITRLRLLAKDCAYGNAEDDMVRDRLVFGTNSAKVRERLINEGAQLTLEKAIQIAQNFEYSQQQLKTMGPLATESSTVPKDVSMINRGRPHTRGRGRANTQQQRSTAPTYRRETPQKGRDSRGKQRGRENSEAQQNKCRNCGFNHQKDARCPAQGKQCGRCMKWNHFAKVCKSVCEIHEYHGADENEYVNDDDVSDQYDAFFIDCIEKSCTSVKNNEAYAELNVNVMHANDVTSNSTLNCKLDTGSQVNVLPLDVFRHMHVPYPLRQAHKLQGYGGSPLKSLGVCSLDVSCKGQQVRTDFHVVDPRGKTAPPILGLPSCLNVGLVKLVDSVNLCTPLSHSIRKL